MIQIFNPFLLSLVFLKMKHSKSSNFSQCSVSPGNCSFIIGNIKLTSSPFQPYSPNNKKKRKRKAAGLSERCRKAYHSGLFTFVYQSLHMAVSENSDLGRFLPSQHSWFCIDSHLGYIHHLIQSQYETVLIGIVGFCMHCVWSWSLKVQNNDKSALVTFFWAERFYQSMWPLGILCSSSTYILRLQLFLMISGKKS